MNRNANGHSPGLYKRGEYGSKFVSNVKNREREYCL